MNKDTILDHTGKQHCTIFADRDGHFADTYKPYGVVIHTLAQKLMRWIALDTSKLIRSEMHITIIRSGPAQCRQLDEFMAAIFIKEPSIQEEFERCDSIYKRERTMEGLVTESIRIKQHKLTFEVVPPEPVCLRGKSRLALIVRQHNDLIEQGYNLRKIAHEGALSLEVAEMNLKNQGPWCQPFMVFLHTDRLQEGHNCTLDWMGQ